MIIMQPVSNAGKQAAHLQGMSRLGLASAENTAACAYMPSHCNDSFWLVDVAYQTPGDWDIAQEIMTLPGLCTDDTCDIPQPAS